MPLVYGQYGASQAQPYPPPGYQGDNWLSARPATRSNIRKLVIRPNIRLMAPRQMDSLIPQNDEEANDPQHGVARISIVQGDVDVRRGDTGGLVAAVVNAPLMAQDHLQTSDGSRAEVEFDYGNLVRLAPDTDLVFADVEYHKYQVQLAAGTIIYRVLRNANSQCEIDTPSVRSASYASRRIPRLSDARRHDCR